TYRAERREADGLRRAAGACDLARGRERFVAAHRQTLSPSAARIGLAGPDIVRAAASRLRQSSGAHRTYLANVMQYNLTEAVQEHYDLASPYYEKLWGKHLHHGFYQTGEESKEEAAENLIEFLVERAGIREGARVLDVGCGIGGTSAWLSERLGCEVTGITISPIQIRMATEATRHLSNRPTFMLDDANNLSVNGSFDIVWAVEVLSHLYNRGEFFRRMSRLLV